VRVWVWVSGPGGGGHRSQTPEAPAHSLAGCAGANPGCAIALPPSPPPLPPFGHTFSLVSLHTASPSQGWLKSPASTTCSGGPWSCEASGGRRGRGEGGGEVVRGGVRGARAAAALHLRAAGDTSVVAAIVCRITQARCWHTLSQAPYKHPLQHNTPQHNTTHCGLAHLPAAAPAKASSPAAAKAAATPVTASAAAPKATHPPSTTRGPHGRLWRAARLLWSPVRRAPLLPVPVRTTAAE
jgi:hypothetical protein